MKFMHLVEWSFLSVAKWLRKYFKLASNRVNEDDEAKFRRNRCLAGAGMAGRQRRAVAGVPGASGAGADDLRNGATDPAFLGSVLDFVMMDDVWVVAFCDSAGLSYDAPMRARAALPGGEQVNWT